MKLTPEKVHTIFAEWMKTIVSECKGVVAIDGKQASRTGDAEKGHGRIEIREYFLSTDIEWPEQRDDWTNLNALGMVRSKVIDGENESEFTRYFITSLTDINEFAYAVRKHWSIENQLHWCLDVIF